MVSYLFTYLLAYSLIHSLIPPLLHLLITRQPDQTNRKTDQTDRKTTPPQQTNRFSILRSSVFTGKTRLHPSQVCPPGYPQSKLHTIQATPTHPCHQASRIYLFLFAGDRHKQKKVIRHKMLKRRFGKSNVYKICTYYFPQPVFLIFFTYFFLVCW